MKRYYILLCFIIIHGFAFTQNYTSISNDFKYLAMHNLNVNTSAISTFSNISIKGTQYIYDKWTLGNVTTNENVTYSKNFLFNFDKVNQNLYIKYTEQNDLIILLDRSTISSFKVGEHAFMAPPNSDPKLKNTFLEILVPDSAVTLYRSSITKFVKYDPTSMFNLRTGNFSDEFVETITYYVSFKNGALKKVNLSENSISRVFKDMSEKTSQYFGMNSNKELDESILIDLVRYLN